MTYFASDAFDAFVQFQLPSVIFALVLILSKGEKLGIALLMLIGAAFIPRINWPDQSAAPMETSLHLIWVLPSTIVFYYRTYSRWVILACNLFLTFILFFLPFALIGWLALMIISLIKSTQGQRGSA